MLDWWSFWVESIWGSGILALFGTGFMYVVIGWMGRMSFILLSTMMLLYFVIFTVGYGGMIFWLPMFLFALIYFFMQLYKFAQGFAD